MNFSFLGNRRVFSKRYMAAILLNSGTLAWYFIIQFNISSIFTTVSAFLFCVCAAASAIGASLIGNKIYNKLFFVSWIAFGTLSTILLTLLPTQRVLMPLLGILIGVSLGLGLPSSMSFIANSTHIEERAKVSGITIFVTFGLAILVMMMSRILGFNYFNLVLLLIIVRSISFLALLLDEFDMKNTVLKDQYELHKPEYATLAFYIIPWLMFIFVSMFAWNLIPQDQYSSAVTIGQILRFTCIALFGLATGFIADRLGRRPPITFGLLVLGASFFILGQGLSDLSVIIYLTASGIAWGSFFAMYLVVPGDLSTYGSIEKFYALITVLPLILIGLTSSVPGISDLTYSSTLSQILSFILFLSIIPVWRARETLPEKKMRERRLKEHVQKVGEVVSESKKKE